MTSIDNTGERILLEKETPLMIARHLCAYRFAKDYVKGKRVLDIGCGQGYGSDYLAQAASSVLGIDYNQDAVRFARDTYRKPNLSFEALDAKDLGSLKPSFDVICSFQVIEHIRDTDGFLGSIKGLLAEDGVFICSTPNKLDASPRSATPLNKFHVREFLLGEFRKALGAHFKEVRMHGLKRGLKLNFYRRVKKAGICDFLPDHVNPVKRFYAAAHCGNFVMVMHDLQGALDFFAVCAK